MNHHLNQQHEMVETRNQNIDVFKSDLSIHSKIQRYFILKEQKMLI